MIFINQLEHAVVHTVIQNNNFRRNRRNLNDEYERYLNILYNIVIDDNIIFQKCSCTSELKNLDKDNKLFFQTVPRQHGNSCIVFKFINNRCIIIGRYYNGHFVRHNNLFVSHKNIFRDITIQHYRSLNCRKSDYNAYIHQYTYFIQQ